MSNYIDKKPSIFDIKNSPAIPSAILLYGIVFLLAIAYYAGIPWQRTYTIVLYNIAAIWVGWVIFYRASRAQLDLKPFNFLDLLFAVFSVCVLVSIGLNWWSGTWYKLQLLPYFFFFPYLLGRMMRAKDCYELRDILIVLGPALLLLIFPEYLRVLKYGLPYANSPMPVLFGLGYGVMLSGLLLSVALLGTASALLSPNGGVGLRIFKSAGREYLGYAALFIIVVTIGWISSRGPALAAFIGVTILLLLVRKSTRRRKIVVCLVLVLAMTAAIVNSLQHKANADYYAHLVRMPVLYGGADGRDDLSGEAQKYHSILGDEVCDKIIDSVSDRWIHYQQAVAIFLANPWFGAGANHYGFFACSGPGSFPHNTILQVFAELGSIVGLIYCGLIAVTMWVLLRRWWSSKPEFEPIWAWFLAFAVMQALIMQINGDYFISAALYFVMGVAANSNNDARAAPEAC